MAKAVNVRPLNDRILVKRTEQEDKTAGGLIIPDSAKEKQSKGEVVAVGVGRVTDDGKTIPLEVKVGDKILFGTYAGTELKIDGVEYLMMRENEVFGVIN
ncbi:MAG: co-chaperone GroES [Bdellovibrionaceae bacterium]|nr:co-chaperone GroES [Pseudobdellovibrionaceae bacterium]